jgi:NAD(P)H dehydrogenase (quinone)
MNILIVYAHHEPASFNGAMLRSGVAALTAAGHKVEVSDLYAMGFDPVSDRRNFTTTFDARRLKQQAEEKHASDNNGYAASLAAEMDKVDRCDVLVFQFPIWWLGMPAILKGWVDRVFAVGRAYGGGRYFETGRFRGKRAMLATTTGGLNSDFSGDKAAAYADIQTVLYPIRRGILEFLGFDVAEPFVAYGPNRISDEERERYLARYSEALLALTRRDVIVGSREASRIGATAAGKS